MSFASNTWFSFVDFKVEQGATSKSILSPNSFLTVITPGLIEETTPLPLTIWPLTSQSNLGYFLKDVCLFNNLFDNGLKG